MFNGSKLRHGFLATISIAIASVTVYAIADPHVGNRQVADFVFPDHIPLASWQELSSESLATVEKPNQNQESVKAAKRYLYEQDDLSLLLEMRYLVGTRGNLANLLQEYFEFSSAMIATQQVKSIPGVGSYLLIQEPKSNEKLENISYLSSCLTPLGKSITEQKEFSALLNQVDLTPKLIWDWLWGAKSLRDRRCLWVNLTLSSQDGNSDHNHEHLEQVWLELYYWWQPHFPKIAENLDFGQTAK